MGLVAYPTGPGAGAQVLQATHKGRAVFDSGLPLDMGMALYTSLEHGAQAGAYAPLRGRGPVCGRAHGSGGVERGVPRVGGGNWGPTEPLFQLPGPALAFLPC